MTSHNKIDSCGVQSPDVFDPVDDIRECDCLCGVQSSNLDVPNFVSGLTHQDILGPCDAMMNILCVFL